LRPARSREPHGRCPGWVGFSREDNHHALIGKESYFLSADGLLMPMRKDRSPPDPKYFKQAGK
jgi:hypothetical protein